MCFDEDTDVCTQAKCRCLKYCAAMTVYVAELITEEEQCQQPACSSNNRKAAMVIRRTFPRPQEGE